MTKCGLFNQIKKKDGFLNEKNIKIYNNSASSFSLNVLYKTFDCKLGVSGWWSNSKESFLMFSLINREIKLNSFQYSRYSTSWYPSSLEVLGWNGLNWQQIYINETISIDEGSSETFIFNSEQYFSSFMFKQLNNSKTAKYIEFYKFEIFGAIRNVFHKLNTCNCHKASTNYAFVLIFLCVS